MKQAIKNEKKISVSIHSNMVALRQRLTALRKEHKLTQEQLAEELNVSRSCVASWESGERIPNLQNLKDLAEYYNVTGDYLLGFVDKKNETRPFERF